MARKGPTNRQRLLVKGLAKGKKGADAAIAAGYSPKNARQSASQALQQIQKTAPELLAAHGLSDEVLIDKYLRPLLDAEETKFFPHHEMEETTEKILEGEGENARMVERPVKRSTFKLAERNCIAWNPRRDGLDMAFKIRGMYQREQENKGPEFSVIIIDSGHRPDWSAMRKAQPQIEVPGLTVQSPQGE